MPEKITVEIPTKLAEFIDKLTEQGYFSSRDDFARCSLEIIAQLYGIAKTNKSGKSLLDILVDNGKSTTKAVTPAVKTMPAKTTPRSMAEARQAAAPMKEATLTPEEYDIMDMFTGATFEFEDALHARYTMELMKLAKAPIPKGDFIKKLEGLAAKQKIERTEHKKKIVWKLLEKY